MKKRLSVFLTAILISASMPVDAADELTFSDVKGHWAQNLIWEDAERGFITGYHDGTFRPNDPLTMAELITMVNRMFGLTKTGDNTYTDVTDGKWYRSEADKAEYYHYWAEPRLNGNSKARRLDLLKMMDSLLQAPVTNLTAPFLDLEGLNGDELDLVNRFYAAGYLNGDGRGNSNILETLTRAEMLTVFHNCLGYIVRTQEDVKNIPKGGKVTVIGQNIVLEGAEIDELILSPGVYTNVTINNCKISELRVLSENTGNTVSLTDSEIGKIQNTTKTKIEQHATAGQSHKSHSPTTNAQAPVITADLTNYTVDINASLVLDATATVSDGGTVTYQWYSADDAIKTNPLARTTGAAYTVDTASMGAFYYYCTVTNTNPAVNGATTAKTDTAVSSITVTPYLTGAGTSGDPFLVGSVEDLCLIGTGLNADGNTYGLDRSYKLERSLDFADPDSYNDAAVHMDSLSGWDYVDETTTAVSTAGGITAGFLPLGNDVNPFTGEFEGNGQTISHLYINRTAADYIGLFGATELAEIYDVGLVDLNVSGKDRVGGLIGCNSSSTIRNCYAAGSVNGVQEVGGLAGGSINVSTMRNCYASGSVSGNHGVGGLVGRCSGLTIINSYTTGNVGGEFYVGGLIGQIDNASISDSYATGNVGYSDGVGGLVGFCFILDLTNTIAFNREITSAFGYNRVLGYDGGAILINNYANSAMTVNGAAGTSGTTTDLNGADISNMTTLSSEPLSGWEFDADINGDLAYWVLMPGTNRPVIYTDSDGDGTFTKLGPDDGM